jgi:tyrosyl-tRNA synthetase
MSVSTDTKQIEQLFTRRVEQVVVADSLKEKLAAGKPLRIKLGVDPTAPDIHLGHAVALKKLREFQDLGHQAILLIGDYTALIGDPTGKSKTRPPLTPKQVEANAATYLEQAGKVLDMETLEVRRNSEWFGEMPFLEVLNLAGKFTVAQMIEREDFRNRMDAGTEIGMHELMYPMMQAYDSIALEADVELGGTDQMFNILAGRDLQKKLGQPQQDAMFLGPILVGLDGTQKMSKSLGNYIGVTEAPEEMYGKTMSVTDEAMWVWFEMVTDLPVAEIAEIKAACESGEMNPRDAKARLAREIVTLYHSTAAAAAAEEHFDKVVRHKELPAEIPEYELPGAEQPLINLLVDARLAASKSEARRLIEQGGVKVDGEAVTDLEFVVKADSESLIQKGKRQFVKVVRG